MSQRDKSRWVWIAAGFLAVTIVGFSGCNSSGTEQANVGPERPHDALVEADTPTTDNTLKVLETEHRALAEKIRQQRQSIQELTKDHGAMDPEVLHELELKRLAIRHDELTRVELHRIELQSELAVVERDPNGMPAEKLDRLRLDSEKLRAYEQRLTAALDKQKAEIVRLERALLHLDDLRFAVKLDQELQEQIRRRIAELRIEQRAKPADTKP